MEYHTESAWHSVLYHACMKLGCCWTVSSFLSMYQRKNDEVGAPMRLNMIVPQKEIKRKGPSIFTLIPTAVLPCTRLLVAS